MRKTTDNLDFLDIADSIINTKKFNELKKESHHGLTRDIHVMRVSKYTYKITKTLGMDYVSATRAALLHDYFTESDFNGTKGIKKGIYHPIIAFNNASKEFSLNEIEKNAITSHMFPLGKAIPKHKESWVLTLVDKSVATYELTKFKFKNAIAVYTIFLINMILFGQR